MERKRKIIAALADLKQEKAGPVPVDLISKWQHSKKDEQAQEIILKPFERKGYLVSSDSAGLSRLTAERSLIEVMNIVSQPKEIIYSHGIKIGGRGVGVWVADNTEMFYDESIAPEQVLEQMAAAQKKIHQQLLQVGMAVHYGTFWEIGGGMFGEDAAMLEAVAEDFTDAKEIIISETVKAILNKKFSATLALREDLQFAKPFYTLNYDQLGQGAPYVIDYRYPVPFSTEFFKALKHYGISDEAKQVIENHFVNKVVVLIKVYHPKFPLLLEELTNWVVANAMLAEIAAKYDVQLVKSNGDLGIYIADNAAELLQFAEDVLLTMRGGEDLVSIGLAAGEVLLFKLDNGSLDIAGGAVNIASKISEDISEQNSFYVHESVEIPALVKHKFTDFAMEKSHVMIKGMKYAD